MVGEDRQVAGHLDELPGARNQSLRQFREEAVVEFRAAGFPTLKHEAWKYTDLSRVATANYDIRVRNGGYEYIDIFLPREPSHRMVSWSQN